MIMKKRGFTLNELLIAVVIVSITAGLAIPMYMRTVEKVKGDEARGTLRLLRAAEKVYYFDWQSQYENLATLASGGYLQNPNANDQRAFDYVVAADNVASPRRFTATATRRNGCNSGETITLDDSGTQGGTWTFRCGP